MIALLVPARVVLVWTTLMVVPPVKAQKLVPKPLRLVLKAVILAPPVVAVPSMPVARSVVMATRSVVQPKKIVILKNGLPVMATPVNVKIKLSPLIIIKIVLEMNAVVEKGIVVIVATKNHQSVIVTVPQINTQIKIVQAHVDSHVRGLWSDRRLSRLLLLLVPGVVLVPPVIN